jgi:hypothetical protein
MGSFFSNLRFGFRVLRKSLAFFITAVLVLALGIGANSAVFSVVDAVLLRRLPYPQMNKMWAISSSSCALESAVIWFDKQRLGRVGDYFAEA